jgi:hypothetical protein
MLLFPLPALSSSMTVECKGIFLLCHEKKELYHQRRGKEKREPFLAHSEEIMEPTFVDLSKAVFHSRITPLVIC